MTAERLRRRLPDNSVHQPLELAQDEWQNLTAGFANFTSGTFSLRPNYTEGCYYVPRRVHSANGEIRIKSISRNDFVGRGYLKNLYDSLDNDGDRQALDNYLAGNNKLLLLRKSRPDPEFYQQVKEYCECYHRDFSIATVFALADEAVALHNGRNGCHDEDQVAKLEAITKAASSSFELIALSPNDEITAALKRINQQTAPAEIHYAAHLALAEKNKSTARIAGGLTFASIGLGGLYDRIARSGKGELATMISSIILAELLNMLLNRSDKLPQPQQNTQFLAAIAQNVKRIPDANLRSLMTTVKNATEEKKGEILRRAGLLAFVTTTGIAGSVGTEISHSLLPFLLVALVNALAVTGLELQTRARTANECRSIDPQITEKAVGKFPRKLQPWARRNPNVALALYDYSLNKPALAGLLATALTPALLFLHNKVPEGWIIAAATVGAENFASFTAAVIQNQRDAWKTFDKEYC